MLIKNILEIADDSDLEGTSPGGHGKGSKKERHFWQYNVQAKGPKGQKILIQTKMEDPHVLNEVVDPVFSGDVMMQGIKHRLVRLLFILCLRIVQLHQLKLPSPNSIRAVVVMYGFFLNRRKPMPC